MKRLFGFIFILLLISMVFMSCEDVNNGSPDISITGKSEASGDDGSLSNGDLIDFGNVYSPIDEDLSFTIGNAGDSDLTVSSIVLSGSDVYSLPTNPAPVNIPVGEEQVFIIRFTSDITGARTGTVTINSDDPDESSFQLSLTGYATS
ncbi:choice-of-anchor D domain-containing protein [Oceanispirochaeta crateris]|uniref:choice-of-anchor D domain-containing protein n=1 Tax=Oceanispirochaeta crateris TaxID=2518645 RepID=UPI00143DDAAD|nr:choice-of-anchor D domain-containing protein [Oceanispirochaeta crateris]